MTTDKRLSASQTMMLSHAVMIGVTPLIPVPFLDDAVKSYLQRRLVRAVGRSRSVEIAAEDVKQLADDRGGCLLGCVGAVLVYPIKKVLRKIFFFLEMKRAVDLVSISYHRALLVDAALERGFVGSPGTHPASEVRAAIDDVIRQAPVRPVEEAVRATFRQSRNALKGAAAMMGRALSGFSRRATPEEVGPALETVRDAEAEQVEGIVAMLASRLNAIPAEHFEALRQQLAARLQAPRPQG